MTTVAVLVAANVLHGIRYDSPWALFAACLVLGVLNAVLRPIMLLLSLPLLVVTFGLFALVINAVLLYLVGQLVKGFHVDGFKAAVWGSLLISLVSVVVTALTGAPAARTPPPGRWSARGPRRRPLGAGD